MSADNWAICPQCVKNLENEVTQLRNKLAENYGKIPANTYLQLVREVESKEKNKITDPTLREDYEIGIDQESTFDIVYSASCTVCSYSFKYKYQQDVSLNDRAA